MDMTDASRKRLKQRTGPERKRARKTGDMGAQDTISVKDMEVLSLEEFLQPEPRKKFRGKALGKKPGKGSGKNRRKLFPVSFEEFFAC